ncbi:hypothetical protein TWF970_001683 [Orbilia oligospora]|uniref:Uncharacterized protein n=1 Tax=Orbilia oligospora TaxID=2813651 RepID=A0A7C8VDG8_ORBOL|nr:hypothetical protein TWF970_001683 [Orbilia oligospora]
MASSTPSITETPMKSSMTLEDIIDDSPDASESEYDRSCVASTPSPVDAESEADEETAVEAGADMMEENTIETPVEAGIDTLEEAKVKASIDMPGKINAVSTVPPDKYNKFRGERVYVIEEWKSDIILCMHGLDERIIHFFVSRDVLWLSSPVMRRLLVSHAQEYPFDAEDDMEKTCMTCECPEGSRAMHLDNEDPEVFLKLLQIVHHKPDAGLLDANFDTIIRIAINCKKYQLHQAILPWEQIWVGKYLKHILEPGYENWLCIGEVFDVEDKLTELIEVLAEECSITYKQQSSERVYVLRYEMKVFVDLWPIKYLDRVLTERAVRVQRLTNTVKELNNILQSSQNICSQEACKNLSYGSLVRSIKAAGLWEIAEGRGSWHGSAIELSNITSRFNFMTGRNLWPDHKCHFVALKEKFKAYTREGYSFYSMDWSDYGLSEE